VFLRIIEPRETLTFTFDGRPIQAAPGESVAAALLQAGVRVFRTSVPGGEPRGPHCLMGICFDCLVTIDGVPNRQSCQVDAAAGMVVESQHGARAVEWGERP
jgi:predicted molibdopterin-dependent oxidoreductase YjgC